MLANEIKLLSSKSLYLALYVLGTYVIYSFFVYPLFLHPLRDIPQAHWSVSFPYVGSVWIAYQRYRQRNNATTYNAHQKHGEVVRLGYKELSINCVNNGVRTVYGGGWDKTDYYARKYACYGVTNMFTTVHRGPHSQKKRTIANVYSKSYIQGSPQLKCNSTFLLTKRILPLLQSFSDSGKAVEVLDMNRAFTMDFSSAYFFGVSRSTNLIQDDQARSDIMRNYSLRHGYEWHRTEIPPWLQRWMKTLYVSIVPKHVAEANQYLEKWTTSMCESADEYLCQHSDELQTNNPGDEPIVYKNFKIGIARLRNKDPEAGWDILPCLTDSSLFLKSSRSLELMSRYELHSEMFDHLEAGHATSTTSLTYLYWEMSRNSSMQKRLSTELLQLTPRMVWPWPLGRSIQDFELPDAKNIDSLPYLHAVIMETLRLHAPIPGHEPRISPYVPGGSTLGRFSDIPGGITVSAMAYTLHRNAEVFPEPEVFNPDRWLTSDAEQLKEMYRWFWAFGSGGRMCIGSHFAVQEMKLLAAAIYINWKTEVVDDEGIEQIDGHATRPRSNKLILRFVHR